MANNNQNNQNGNGKGGYNPDQYKAQKLADGLIEKLPVPLNLNSIVFKEKTSVLETKLEDLIENTLHIAEIDHIAIKPKMARDGSVQAILCRAYFDTSDVTTGDIVRKDISSGTSNSGVRTIIPLVGGAVIGSGDFEISDNFKKVFAPMVANDDGQINIGSLPKNKNIAALDLDFFALMTVALGISSESPYNFTILGISPIGNNGDDFMMLISKYIDTSRKRGRHGRGNKTDYHNLDREWAKQEGAYYNSGKKRSF